MPTALSILEFAEIFTSFVFFSMQAKGIVFAPLWVIQRAETFLIKI